MKTAASFVLVLCLISGVDVAPVAAQSSCFLHTVGPALTDLGTHTYNKLKPVPGASPSTWIYEPQPGMIGGLYPGGVNTRPPAHDAAGLILANQVQPLDAAGNPSTSGRIGLVSVGMSNTQQEFGRFKAIADADTEINDTLVIVNGALSGGTVERWTNPSDPSYGGYWDNFDNQIAQNGLTHAQVQVAWVKITQRGANGDGDFPENMRLLESRLELLARELKRRLPRLRITYFSSRARSTSYSPNQLAEPGAFENGFAVRWLIERQINRDPSLNYQPTNGPTPVSYMAWGPYLWIDGTNPRSDGRTWPVTNTDLYDCIHPSAAGEQAIAEMLLEFFKSDATATSWFLGSVLDDTVPPTVPTNLAATAASTSRIDLSWTASTDNRAVTRYDIYRCTGLGCVPGSVAAASVTPAYSDANVTAGTAYVYAVAAVDAAGNVSPISVSVAAATMPEASTLAISNVTTAIVASTSATITWNTSVPALSHLQFVGVCPGSGCQTTFTLPLATTHVVLLTNLSPNTTYTFRVHAGDANRNTVASALYSFRTSSLGLTSAQPGGR
jgi:hypothetical protein